jgi:major membrane immunogen (membrane-anchored lipoprotein)
MLKVINNLPNLEHHDNHEESVSQNEIMFPSIPIAKGKYSDTGYQYRHNHVKIKSTINPFKNATESEFFDIQ